MTETANAVRASSTADPLVHDEEPVREEDPDATMSRSAESVLMLKGFQDTFAKTIGTFIFFLVLFASAIVFGVVYNAARIALAERGRELASLRVLGFTKTMAG